MANKPQLVWEVRLNDLHRALSAPILIMVIADSASHAEERAIALQGPINNGAGYVYKLQASEVKLRTMAH